MIYSLQGWLTILEVQLEEAKEDMENCDLEHFQKELADIVLVGMDALADSGCPPWDAIRRRLTENAGKNLETRTVQYYEDKLIELKRKQALRGPAGD